MLANLYSDLKSTKLVSVPHESGKRVESSDDKSYNGSSEARNSPILKNLLFPSTSSSVSQTNHSTKAQDAVILKNLLITTSSNSSLKCANIQTAHIHNDANNVFHSSNDELNYSQSKEDSKCSNPSQSISSLKLHEKKLETISLKVRWKRSTYRAHFTSMNF